MAGPPRCAPPDPNPRRPSLRLPALACDSHAHICGPEAKYPYSPRRIYTPADAVLPDYQRMLATLGIERAVLVQPSFYGTDNAALLDALAAGGQAFRGVAVLEDTVDPAEIQRLHEAGVRGLRCNIVDVQPEEKGKLPLARLTRLAEKIQPLGWHLELLLHVDEFPDFDRAFADFPVDIVVGHLGYMRTDRGMQHPGFQALVRLMQRGRCWAKLTGPYRISTQPLPYPDVTPFAHALAAAAPERLVWGTDWPHVIVKGAMPNDGDLCDLLAGWIPDPGLREQVLVTNPARLYGF
jgi:predicted TIM-barrel fold metal-dependent hydrolase